MEKIAKISKIFKILFITAFFLVPVASLCFWLFINDIPKHLLQGGPISLASPIQTPEGWFYFGERPLSLLSRGLGFLSSFFYDTAMMLGLYYLIRLFSLYEKGAIFTSENVKAYKILGYTLFSYALFIKPIAEGIMVTAVTFSNPPGHRYFSIGFGTPNVGYIMIGALIILISWVMNEGKKLQEEQSYTI